MREKYDFSGWATKNDLLCQDGRTIRRGAFREQDGTTVPLVWNHGHKDPTNVLGHAVLENRKDGVYAYCKFNNTPKAQHIKESVINGDLNGLSIYANGLVQRAGNVVHGAIREVSLVLAGANPGATIDTVLAHSEEPLDGYGYEFDPDGGIIYTGEPLVLCHSANGLSDEEDEAPTVEEIFDGMTDEQKDVVYFMIEQAVKRATGQAPEEDDNMSRLAHSADYEEAVAEVYDSLDDDQKEAVDYLLGQAYESGAIDADDDYEDDDYEDDDDYDEDDYDEDDEYYEEDDDVKHNVFYDDDNYLAHSGAIEIDFNALNEDAKRIGSMREAFLQHSEMMGLDSDELMHSANYGIEQIDMLFPEYKSLNTPPEWVSRNMSWVDGVLNGVHHVPFSRIKSMFADIREDDARAKGYMKGNLKKEEVFSLLKRTTDPQTIYKKQKIDRDDVLDITDFDVIAWIKAEMRMMLDEEIARAILVGDGRLNSSDDKIKQDHVRSIYLDDPFYSIKVPVKVSANATDEEKAKALINAAIKARKLYKGSGNLTFYTTADVLTDGLLLEDGIGHKLYKSEAELATAMRMSKIVEVEVMEGLTREGEDHKTRPLLGIAVNLKDYSVGADKGGAVNMFDDFDIDYNQNKYLIETRMSGALIKPYSALVFELDQAAGGNGGN